MLPAQGDPKRIGLLAAWGRYPVVVAEALRDAGYQVFCVGVRDYVDPAIADACTAFETAGLARLGQAVRFYRRHDVRRATMAGKVHKVDLFQPGVWRKYIPDLLTLRTFWPHFVSRRKDRRDDSLLLAVVNGFAKAGITFAPATDYMPDMLVKPGLLTRLGPTPAQQADIQFGWWLAKEMGRLDVGQSVAVKNRAPLAVEAIEGTDECIKRAGRLCASGGFTIVKVAKPQQDMRFDVPTIGQGTLETMAASGAAVLAIEADRTILLDQPQFIELADRLKLIVVALREPAESAIGGNGIVATEHSGR